MSASAGCFGCPFPRVQPRGSKEQVWLLVKRDKHTGAWRGCGYHNALWILLGFSRANLLREIVCQCPSLTLDDKALEPKTRQGEYRAAEEAWDSKSTNFTLLLNSDSPKRGYHGSHPTHLLLPPTMSSTRKGKWTQNANMKWHQEGVERVKKGTNKKKGAETNHYSDSEAPIKYVP